MMFRVDIIAQVNMMEKYYLSPEPLATPSDLKNALG